MVADGEGVSVKMTTSGYHTGEIFGLPPTGKGWTNHGNAIFTFSDGKISNTDFVFDDVNLIKQIGGTIQPADPWRWQENKS
jgi:predicted ester cyclase